MSKGLIEKKNDLIIRAEEILRVAKEETRELTEDEAKEITQLRDDAKKIDETLSLEEEIRALDKRELKKDSTPKEGAEMNEKENLEARALEEEKIFADYIRGNERADMTKTDNGALIPETIVNRIIRKVYDISPILDRSQKFNVKGTLSVPYYPADANNITVAYQTEFVAMTGSAGKTSSVSLTGFLAGALTKVSRSLVNNTNIDVVGFVVDEMAQQIARWLENECLHGTTNKIEGLSTLTNAVTTASATAITAEEVVKLHDKIKDQFQQNAIWIMSPATRTALRLLKSNTGYFLLNDDISTPFGTTLLGKPVYVSDNMDDIATGKDVIYYGDMRGLATKFNEEINIQILREKYADEHALGVIGWLEFDAKVVDEQQIAKMTMA